MPAYACGCFVARPDRRADRQKDEHHCMHLRDASQTTRASPRSGGEMELDKEHGWDKHWAGERGCMADHSWDVDTMLHTASFERWHQMLLIRHPMLIKWAE